MMSQRPKPTSQKIAEGNRGHRPIEGDDFQPPAIAPELPRGLSRAARREWHRMVRMLMSQGVLTEVDGKALAAYCESFAQAEVALKHIQSVGQVVDVNVLGKDGEVIRLRIEKNPSWAIWIEAIKAMKAFLIEFGLTPASRSKLKLPKKPEEDEIDKLLGRGKGKSVPGFTQPTPPAQPGTEAVNKSGKPEVQ